MKTTIFVFSGTGTSLAVAKKMSMELGDTELISIAKYREQEAVISVQERVGFVFPCNYGELPQIVKDFVEKVKLDHVRYIFSIITAGGNAGFGLQILNELLGEKGKELNYGNTIVIASNYIIRWYNSIANSNKTNLRDIVDESDKKIKQFAQDIMEEKSYIKRGSWLGYTFPHIMTPKRIIQDTKPWDTDFNAGEKCSGCGICKNVCPAQNIQLTENKPKFMHNCLRCMACIQYCPRKAIKYKGKYIERSRYYHPKISINEISEFNSRLL